jgi:hypothetical protein
MKLKLIFPILFVFSFCSLYGNKSLIIYETYEDYINNTGEVIEGDFKYAGTEASFGKTLTKFKNKDKSTSKENNKIKIDGKKIWGFKHKGVLFRTINGVPQWVATQGELIYYENGVLKLFNLNLGNNNAPWWEEYGYECGISKDLTSEFIYIPPGLKIGKSYIKDLKKFIDKNPSCESFYNCVINHHVYVKDIRRCAERFTKIKVVK